MKFVQIRLYNFEMYEINENYDVIIDCKVKGNGFTMMSIFEVKF